MSTSNSLRGRWFRESVIHGEDPLCGSVITQLTSQTTMATSIYCEDPNCSAECGRIVVLRGHHTHLMTGAEVWVTEPETGRSALIDCDGSIYGSAQHAYSDLFFFARHSSGSRELVRLCLSTLETETVHRCDASHPGYHTIGSLSPDSRFHVNEVRRPQSVSQVVVLDLETGIETVIAEGTDLFNPHPRFDRMAGEWVLVQHNRGQRITPDDEVETFDPSQGTTLFAVRRDGSERRDLPVARPFIAAGVSGHEAWIKGEPEFVASLAGADSPYDDGTRAGNLVLCRLGSPLPKVIAHAPDTYFGHVSTSCCGRFWVCDAWPLDQNCVGPPDVVIGSLASGKFARLCRVRGHWTNFETGHAHPYLTADSRYVIFGSTRAGMPQVYAASVPDGVLDALE